ncbi:TPA: hypothetical protein ACH3X2_013474 [Trebouxia sp. C0005]
MLAVTAACLLVTDGKANDCGTIDAAGKGRSQSENLVGGNFGKELLNLSRSCLTAGAGCPSKSFHDHIMLLLLLLWLLYAYSLTCESVGVWLCLVEACLDNKKDAVIGCLNFAVMIGLLSVLLRQQTASGFAALFLCH